MQLLSSRSFHHYSHNVKNTLIRIYTWAQKPQLCCPSWGSGWLWGRLALRRRLHNGFLESDAAKSGCTDLHADVQARPGLAWKARPNVHPVVLEAGPATSLQILSHTLLTRQAGKILRQYATKEADFLLLKTLSGCVTRAYNSQGVTLRMLMMIVVLASEA